MSDSHHKKIVDLVDAILLLNNRDECERFLKDLCTPQELKAMQERFKVCQLLELETLSYRDIHARTAVSMATIGRVARFLREETYGGYRLILRRLKRR